MGTSDVLMLFGRTGSLLIRHADDEQRPRSGGGQSHEDHLGETDL